MRLPDIVANLRVDQAWGSFQVMGALHDNSGYNFVPAPAPVTCNVTALGGTLTGQIACGGPDDKLGFAVGVGGIFKVPMPGGLTDIASFQFNYTEGASRYAVVTQPGGRHAEHVQPVRSSRPARCAVLRLPACCRAARARIGLGYWSDGIYGNPGALVGYDGSVQKTRVWGVNAAWDHLWTPEPEDLGLRRLHRRSSITRLRPP